MNHTFTNRKIIAKEPITLDEAKAEIASFTKLTSRDIDDLLDPSLTQDDLALMIRVYANAGKGADPSTWDKILQVLGCVAQIAGILTSVAGAVSTVIGVVTAARNA